MTDRGMENQVKRLTDDEVTAAWVNAIAAAILDDLEEGDLILEDDVEGARKVIELHLIAVGRAFHNLRKVAT